MVYVTSAIVPNAGMMDEREDTTIMTAEMEKRIKMERCSVADVGAGVPQNTILKYP